MKVLYVISSTQIIGGGSKAFLNLLYGMMNCGVEPLVVCPDRGVLYQNLRKEGINVDSCFYRTITYPPLNRNVKNVLLFIPRLFGRMMVNTIGSFQLCRICKVFRPDIIHTNVSVTGIGYYASRLLHIPHVWHIREYGALDFNYYYYYYYREQQLARYRQKHSYTICITKDIQRYNKLCNYPHSRVIYDGVLSDSRLYYKPQKQSYFLFAGRIEQGKGVLPLLMAYSKYFNKCSTPLPLYLAGGMLSISEYVKECQKVVSDSNLTDYVKFLGIRTDILSLYQNATALIVPSLSEGFGFITAEAMFSGCLVVGNDVAGTKEQFDNGREMVGEDIALRYTEQAQLVQHLLDITTAVKENRFQQKYESMILRSQSVVSKLYTTEVHAQSVFDFYQDIVAENS